MSAVAPTLQAVGKDNPNHDEHGRFSSADWSGSGNAQAAAESALATLHGDRPDTAGEHAAEHYSPATAAAVGFGTNWTAHDQAAVSKYASNYYHAINGALRHTETDPDDTAVGLKVAGEVDKVFARLPATPEPLTVFRGFDVHALSAHPEALVGATITDQGFVSTSTSRIAAERSADYADPGAGAVMTIVVPPGAHALDPLAVAPYMESREQEVILDRGGAFHITAGQFTHGTHGHSDAWSLEAEYVPRQR